MPLDNATYLQAYLCARLANAKKVSELVDCERGGCLSDWSDVACEVQVIKASEYFLSNQLFDTKESVDMFNKIIGIGGIHTAGCGTIDPNVQISRLVLNVNVSGGGTINENLYYTKLQVDAIKAGLEEEISHIQVTGGNSYLIEDDVPLNNVSSYEYVMTPERVALFGTSDPVKLFYKIVSAGTEPHPNPQYLSDRIVFTFTLPDENGISEKISGRLIVLGGFGAGSSSGNGGSGGLAIKEITKSPNDIVGSDPVYYIDLSTNAMPSLPTVIKVYAVYGSDRIDSLPNMQYDPVTKQLSGFAAKENYNGAVLKIEVL